MTYDELLETIESYTVRDDYPLQSFLKRSESYLRTVAKHYLSEQAISLPVVDGEAVLPVDFLEIRTITGTKVYKPIAPMNAKLCFGEVGYYRKGNTLVFVGEVDAEVGFLYSAAFPGLTEDTAPDHWLFQRFPQCYVASLLKEFYRWNKDPEGVAIEDAALKEALSIVAEDDRRGRQTGTIIIAGSTW